MEAEDELGDELAALWEDWLPALRVRLVRGSTRPCPGRESYVALWLEQAVEKRVDDLWAVSPSASFTLDSLAQTMCRCALRELLPRAGESGCLPVPRLTPALGRALEAEGLRDPGAKEDGLFLKRRYALVTYYPFRGSCSVCALEKACPKIPAEGSRERIAPAPAPEAKCLTRIVNYGI
jgi:hypothetical protein